MFGKPSVGGAVGGLEVERGISRDLVRKKDARNRRLIKTDFSSLKVILEAVLLTVFKSWISVDAAPKPHPYVPSLLLFPCHGLQAAST